MSITESTSLKVLHRIMNPNPLLQEKMNFFADYFSCANEFLGKLPGFSFDNPLSIVGKMLFQIENNIERCAKSIDIHIQILSRYECNYLNKAVVSFPAMRTGFIEPWEINRDAKHKIAWLQANPSSIKTIVAVKEELEEKMFDTIIGWLGSYMMCPHGLISHKDDIIFATQIIISYFRLNGSTKKEVDEYIHRILSNDKYTFPLPVEILEQNKTEKFDTLCNDFFTNRDFVRQFNGLKNIVHAQRSRKGYFLYPIVGVQFDKGIEESFLVTFDKVTFISSFHPKLEEVRTSCYVFVPPSTCCTCLVLLRFLDKKYDVQRRFDVFSYKGV